MFEFIVGHDNNKFKILEYNKKWNLENIIILLYFNKLLENGGKDMRTTFGM